MGFLDHETIKVLFDYGVPTGILVVILVMLWRGFKWFAEPIRDEEVLTKIRQREFLDGLEKHEKQRQLLCERHADGIEQLGQGVLECQPAVKRADENVCVLRQAAMEYVKMVRLVLDDTQVDEMKRVRIATLLDAMDNLLENGDA